MNAATILTHGCRSNLAERDALAALAPDGATVVNSCAVTAEAVRDARAAVRKAAANGPVFVTGCAATIEPARFADLAQVIPNAAKFRPESWGRTGEAPVIATRQSRAFVAIQDGCDHDCTFCVTRLARGASRSVPTATVVGEIAALVASGVREVVLTGIDATSYGHDLPGAQSLGRLVQAVLLGVPDLPRLRLSSLDAAEADDALLEAFADTRLMPHVHLSLQSGDDMILKRMKRRHNRADALRLIERLHRARAGIAIGADLIAGFPTEDEAAHRNSLTLIADAGLAHAHIFVFSPRPGTAAARMPQVPAVAARARAAELRALAAAQHNAVQRAMLGRETVVVSEGRAGITPNGMKMRLGRPAPRGTLVRCTPTSIENGELAE